MIPISCQIFAERGNPWVTPREQAELRAQLAPARGGRQLAKPKPVFRDPAVSRKPRSPESLTGEKRMRNVQFFQAAFGGSRTVAPLERKPAPQIPPGDEPAQWPALSEAEKIQAEIERLARDHHRAVIEARRKLAQPELPLL